MDASFLIGQDAFFYANDGHLVGNNPDMLQEGLNIIVELFRHMGLEMNSNKTKAMVFFGGIGSRCMSSEVYAHHFNKSPPTQWEQVLQYAVFIRYSRFHQPENSGAAKVWVCG